MGVAVALSCLALASDMLACATMRDSSAVFEVATAQHKT